MRGAPKTWHLWWQRLGQPDSRRPFRNPRVREDAVRRNRRRAAFCRSACRKSRSGTDTRSFAGLAQSRDRLNRSHLITFNCRAGIDAGHRPDPEPTASAASARCSAPPQGLRTDQRSWGEVSCSILIRTAVMRGILAAVALVSFAVGPAVGPTCLRKCSGTHAGSPHESSCHQSAVPAYQLSDGHDCAVHLAALGLTAKRVEPSSQPPIAVSAAIVPVVVRVARSASKSSDDKSDRGPRPPILIPLRI